MRKLLLFALIVAAPASAQLPGLSRRGPAPPAVVLSPIEQLRSDFSAQAGGPTVYFNYGSALLTPQARVQLSNQAIWLRQHPEVTVMIEGHGDQTDTRDHALAVGAERAGEARNYLILLGIPAAQVGAMTWGKERPTPPSVVTTIQLLGSPAVVPTAG
jgi:peptidoglycan-associated lipoprotein